MSCPAFPLAMTIEPEIAEPDETKLERIEDLSHVQRVEQVNEEREMTLDVDVGE